MPGGGGGGARVTDAEIKKIQSTIHPDRPPRVVVTDGAQIPRERCPPASRLPVGSVIPVVPPRDARQVRGRHDPGVAVQE